MNQEAGRLLATVYRPPRARVPWTLADIFPGAELRLFSFGRRALASALRGLGASGGRVLLPDFLCRDVLSALGAGGCEAVYYPVGADLAPSAAPESWPEARAVLAVDYFGFPQDLAPFRAYAERTGAKIVEDAAHALFSRDASGAPLGLRADAGILSLRKSLAIPNGAALLKPAGLGWRLEDQEPATLRTGRRRSLKDAARRLPPRLLRGLIGASRALRPAPEQGGFPDTAPWEGLSEPIDAADPTLEVERRRALYALVERELQGCARPVFRALPPGTAPYGYPFRPTDEAECRRRLKALALEALPWPEPPTDVRLAHFLW